MRGKPFWERVQKTESCWLWTGGQISNGYGAAYIGRKQILAHRYAYLTEKGPIPDGMELDHLCRVRHCVNPTHLEPVTHRENQRRGVGFPGKARNDSCPNGHLYTPATVRIEQPPAGKGFPYRRCMACRRARSKGGV